MARLRSILAEEGLLTAAKKKEREPLDLHGLVGVMTRVLTNAQVKVAPPMPANGNDVFSLRGKVPGYLTDVVVFENGDTVFVGPAKESLIAKKKVPPYVMLKSTSASPTAVEGALKKWVEAYESMNPGGAPASRGPSVQNVLDHVYRAAPLKEASGREWDWGSAVSYSKAMGEARELVKRSIMNWVQPHPAKDSVVEAWKLLKTVGTERPEEYQFQKPVFEQADLSAIIKHLTAAEEIFFDDAIEDVKLRRIADAVRDALAHVEGAAGELDREARDADERDQRDRFYHSH